MAERDPGRRRDRSRLFARLSVRPRIRRYRNSSKQSLPPRLRSGPSRLNGSKQTARWKRAKCPAERNHPIYFWCRQRTSTESSDFVLASWFKQIENQQSLLRSLQKKKKKTAIQLHREHHEPQADAAQILLSAYFSNGIGKAPTSFRRLWEDLLILEST